MRDRHDRSSRQTGNKFTEQLFVFSFSSLGKSGKVGFPVASDDHPILGVSGQLVELYSFQENPCEC